MQTGEIGEVCSDKCLRLSPAFKKIFIACFIFIVYLATYSISKAWGYLPRLRTGLRRPMSTTGVCISAPQLQALQLS